MITLPIIFAILLVHWFADFVLQTDWQAKNKSKSNWALTQHVTSYSLVWLVIVTFSVKVLHASTMLYWAVPITFAAHWITDFLTSRLNTYLYNKGDIHNFFVSIGFYQILHYVQLFLTYYLLTNV